MVHADPFHNYCVALIVPSRAIEKWARESGIEFQDLSDLCAKDEAVKEVQQSIAKVGSCPS